VKAIAIKALNPRRAGFGLFFAQKEKRRPLSGRRFLLKVIYSGDGEISR
jgi:hypothetical protein